MKTIATFLATLALATSAQAGGFSNCGLHLHIAALHNEPGFETAIPGAGLVCDTPYGELRAATGAYRNSIGRTSVYLGGLWQPLQVGPFKAGGFAGLISGYRSTIIPFGALVGSVDLGNGITLHTQMIPTVKGRTPLTVALSLEFALQ